MTQNIHHRSPTVEPRTELVSEGAPESLVSGANDESVIIASLVGLALDRVPAPRVAPYVKRHQATVYAWAHPATASITAQQLLLAPPAFSRVVLRGMAAHVDGWRGCGAPSRDCLVRVLARAIGLVVSGPTDLVPVPTTDLQQRLRELEEARAQLDQEIRRCDAELLARKANEVRR